MVFLIFLFLDLLSRLLGRLFVVAIIREDVINDVSLKLVKGSKAIEEDGLVLSILFLISPDILRLVTNFGLRIDDCIVGIGVIFIKLALDCSVDL